VEITPNKANIAVVNAVRKALTAALSKSSSMHSGVAVGITALIASGMYTTRVLFRTRQ